MLEDILLPAEAKGGVFIADNDGETWDVGILLVFVSLLADVGGFSSIDVHVFLDRFIAGVLLFRFVAVGESSAACSSFHSSKSSPMSPSCSDVSAVLLLVFLRLLRTLEWSVVERKAEPGPPLGSSASWMRGMESLGRCALHSLGLQLCAALCSLAGCWIPVQDCTLISTCPM